MARVEYNGITKDYGEKRAVNDVDLRIEDGEFVVLVGPSGCGKTTTLQCLAGLVQPTDGEIRVDGEDVTDVHPKDRDIAMVFQNLALYPHMNVRENIGYPLKVAGVAPAEREKQVAEVAELLEISALLDRDVDEISGGQRQRVAIGRAIVRRPSVFLMDEPLASLDAKLKVEMRNRIKVLQRELGITTLFVTHDQEEAMTLADKIAVMNDGEVSQFGTPREIYHEPANAFVARFIGSPSMNLVRVEWADDRRVRATADPDSFAAALGPVAERYAGYDRFDLGVRPQYFDVHADAEPAADAIECTVEVTHPTGDEQLVTAHTGADLEDDGIELTVRASDDLAIERGQRLWLTVEPELVHGFHPETGERIEGESSPERLERAPVDAD